METLLQAVESVQRNLAALIIYAISAALLTAVSQAAIMLLGGPFENFFSDPTTMLYGFGIDTVLVIAFAALESVVFSRMGKNIDRPLWKISGDWEAIRRYFLLWLALDGFIFIATAGAGFAHNVLDNANLAGALTILWIFFSVVYIPVGAAIMFGGPINLRNMAENMRALFRQLSHTFVLLAFAGVVFFFMVYLQAVTEKQQYLWPLINVVDAYFNCVIFADAWLICMYDRQNPEENDIEF